ncbi:MAG: hypothetical protein HKN26_00880, partial [Acidimicrobiales bacterium]|nr:hypothetical protein [Acidimicrobiales bacterium]
FDTGKLVNTFLQFDGHRVVHQEHPALLHVGGVSSHITPMPHGPKIMAKMHADVWRHTGDDLSRLLTEPEARREASIDPKIRPRCSELTAQILIAAHTRQPIPAVPDDLSPAATALLTRLRGEMIDLVERYATP